MNRILNNLISYVSVNFEFLSLGIIASKDYKSNFGADYKIAITAIAISVIMMLISIATGIGLQKIREKVSAFNGDVIITYYDTNFSNDSQHPISKEQPFYPNFHSVDGIKHIQVTASKGGIIRTEAVLKAWSLKASVMILLGTLMNILLKDEFQI